MVCEKSEGGLVKEFSVVTFVEKYVTHREVDCTYDCILHDFSERFAIGWILVELITDAELSLCFCHVGLKGVQVHLITIKVSIVTLAVGIIHTKGGLFGQNLDLMSHQTCFMESRLSVE